MAKLNYRFHNPNTVEVTAEYILKIFMEANQEKLEKAITDFSTEALSESESKESYSA